MEDKERLKVQPRAERPKETEVKNGHPSDEKVVFKNTEVEEGESSEEESVSKGPLEGEQGKVEEVVEDFKSKYLYLAAELENQKKRFRREQENFFKFGGERILGDLIEVIDNLERTIAAIEKDQDEKVQNIVTGINMVKKQFIEVLGRHGLTPLESLGEEFDPSVHEAVAEKESEQEESNKVVSVFEEGYKLKGRLLRAAKVVVSKRLANK